MTGWTTDLLTGLAELGAANGGGLWTPASAYDLEETEPVITIAVFPDFPHRTVTLSPYGPLGQWDDGDVLQGLNIKFRGLPNDPTSTYDLRDIWRDFLDGQPQDASLTEFGGVTVSQIFHDSGTDLPLDDTGRLTWSDNYLIQAARPTALRH